MKVEVYRNLHKNCWSIRNAKTGKVIEHFDYICIKDAKLVVRPAGRAKVLREKRKNVHAFVRGEVATFEDALTATRQISYNPYKHESFMLIDTETPIKEAEIVFLANNGTGWVNG